LRGGERNVQDWISLVCGVLLSSRPGPSDLLGISSRREQRGSAVSWSASWPSRRSCRRNASALDATAGLASLLRDASIRSQEP